MLKKKFSLLIACTLCLVLLGGCSDNLKQTNTNLNSELTSEKKKNLDLEKKVNELTGENQKLSDRVKVLEESNSFIYKNMTKDKNGIYPIYTANEDSLKKEAYLWVYADEKIPIKNRLDIISKALSKTYFGDLPIEVSDFRDINGKKVVVINLKESEENQKIKDPSNFKGPSWACNFFQGSTGGGITSTSLIETILQRDYKGSWIDGVLFKYNNKTIEFEHVPDLGDVIYR